MDYLDKLTQLAQVRGEINIRCLFQGDWQVEHQPDVAEYQGLFHLIEQGECWVTFAEKQFHLKKGDLFFLPQNRPHFLGSSQQKKENSLQRAQSNALFNVHQIGAVISIYPEIPNLKDQQKYFHGGKDGGIVIEDNEFDTFDAPILYAKSVDGLIFRNNVIKTNTEFKPFHWNKDRFLLERVTNVKISE